MPRTLLGQKYHPEITARKLPDYHSSVQLWVIWMYTDLVSF